MKLAITEHAVRVYRTLNDQWRASSTIRDELAGQCGARSVRTHLKALVDADIAEAKWVFPVNYYRLRGTLTREAAEYVGKIREASALLLPNG
jgi:hypothetical protein